MVLSDPENWCSDETISKDRYLSRERRLRDATKAKRQDALALRSKYAQNHEKSVILSPLRLKLKDGEENAGGVHRALEIRPAVKSLHNLRPTEKPNGQLSASPLTETQLGQETKTRKAAQVHKERQNSTGTQVELPQYDTTARVSGEISFKVLCAPSLRNSLPYVQPNIPIHSALHYHTSFVLSDLRDQPHTTLALDGALVDRKSKFASSGLKHSRALAIRTLKPSQDGPNINRAGTVKHPTRNSRKSTQIPSNVTVMGYITAFNDLIKDLLKKYTQGKWTEEKTQNVDMSLSHQVMTYLTLSNLGVPGVDESETLLHLKDGVISSQIHEDTMGLLDVTVVREPFDSWVTGLNNPQPTQLEARVQVTYWFMSICRKTLEELEEQSAEKNGTALRRNSQYLECFLRVGHDNLRMQT